MKPTVLFLISANNLKIMTNEKEIRKAVELIPKTTFVLQEFIAMLAGKKPVVVTTLPSISIKELIVSNFPNLFVEVNNGPWYKKNVVCAVSKNKIIALRAVDYLKLSSLEQGKVLGYPDCCSEKHAYLLLQDKALDSSFVTYKSLQNAKKCNYLTNNLFNFYSRLGLNKKNFENVDKFHKLNKNSFSFPSWNLQYISHMPCRYDCSKSIKIGREIELLLKKYAPNVEKKLKYSLAKPILFFDLFKLIVFDGNFENGILCYTKTIPPLFPFNSPLKESIESGNKMKISKNMIEIYRGNKKIFTYKKKDIKDGFILNFS